MRPARHSLTGPPALAKLPETPSGTKLKGLSAGRKRPDRRFRSLPHTVKYNSGQGGLIQSVHRYSHQTRIQAGPESGERIRKVYF